MSFFSSFRKLFRFGGEDDAKSKKKELFKNIKRDVDPKNLWDILSEIGDGAFGKVYKVRCSHCKILVNFDRWLRCVKNHRHRNSPQMHTWWPTWWPRNMGNERSLYMISPGNTTNQWKNQPQPLTQYGGRQVQLRQKMKIVLSKDNHPHLIYLSLNGKLRLLITIYMQRMKPEGNERDHVSPLN